MTVIRELIDFLKYEKSKAVAAPEQERLRLLFLDWLGCLLAGLKTRAAEDYYSVLTSQTKFSANDFFSNNELNDRDRGLLFGIASHELEWDDSEFIGETHPSAVIWSALLASSHPSADWTKLAAAARMGYFAIYWLGTKMNPAHYESGWHASGSVGCYGATVALSFYLNLNDDQIASALTAVAGQSCGAQGSFGSSYKSLTMGRAVSNAILSVRLGKKNLRGNEDIFERKHGIYDLYNCDVTRTSGLVPSPENLSWIKLKKYPSCHCTHPAIEIAQSLRGNINTSDVAKIVIATSDYTLSRTNTRYPTNREEAYFSLSYCFAVGLLCDFVGLEQFSDKYLALEKTKDLEEKILCLVEEDCDRMEVRVIVEFKNGQILNKSITLNRSFGDENHLFVTDKFMKLASPFLGKEDKVKKLYDLVMMEEFKISDLFI